MEYLRSVFNDLSGLKEILYIQDEKYILNAAYEQNFDLPYSCR